jgi:hypothetical protein
MSPRQIRQLDRLRDYLNKDPYLTPEDKGKILSDFASGFNPPSTTEEINNYLIFHKLPPPTATNARTDTAEAALERHRAAAGFMAGQPPS